MSKPIAIEVKDTALVIRTDVKTIVPKSAIRISQSETGQKPVYLDVYNPNWRYTLYPSKVPNSMVYHVEGIDGKAFDSVDEIHEVLALALSVGVDNG